MVDYFRWRHEDAHRNALNGHCYWLLRRQGLDDAAATRRLEGVSVAARNELLFQHGIRFNDLPSWQKRGIGAYWESIEEEGRDPRTDTPITSTHRALRFDHELPLKDEYAQLVRAQIG